jgi:FkbM family methyltransferase
MRADAREADTELPSACVVYGAGRFGSLLASELVDAGVEVVGMLDCAVDRSDQAIPVWHPEKCPDIGEYPVILGICNPSTSPIEVSGYLSGLGYANVLSPASVFAGLGQAGRKLDHYWLTSDVDIYVRESDQVEQARSQLADERSVSVYTSLLRYRTEGDLGALPDVDPLALQYLPADVDFIDGPVALLDAGAYEGDTIRSYLGAGVDLKSVLALEPDPANFRRLTQELASHTDLVALALPLGLSRGTELVRFTANGTSGATISESGTAIIQCAALDDVVQGWPITHVKMDIEGAEPNALEGMRRLLISTRPRLAISVYHRPEHLWTILLQLADLNLDYRFHLRCYGEQCFDTVLYAIPTD